MILACYVDDTTYHVLQRVSSVTGRSVEDLAESAIAEAALRELPPWRGEQGQMRLPDAMR